MEIVSIRIAINLDLFNILVESDHTQTLDELAAATGADLVLLGTSNACSLLSSLLHP